MRKWWGKAPTMWVLTWALFPPASFAEPPPEADPALAPWFQSLTVPGQGGSTISCCGVADCRGPEVWPVRVSEGGYEVSVEGQWLRIPEGRVSKRPDNPTGDYVTCLGGPQFIGGEPNSSREVICFFTPPRV